MPSSASTHLLVEEVSVVGHVVHLQAGGSSHTQYVSHRAAVRRGLLQTAAAQRRYLRDVPMSSSSWDEAEVMWLWKIHEDMLMDATA